MNIYFVTAIGTGSGKTLISSIICEALHADYWKPIQAGLEEVDSVFVTNLISNSQSIIYPEQYSLKMPASANIAAKAEGLSLSLVDFHLPKTSNSIVVEGAGGILVPINDSGDFIVDLAAKFDCELILVINLYLGCINHSLLTINELRRRGLNMKGIIFNGDANTEVENTILNYSNSPCLFRLATQTNIDKSTILAQASLFLQQNPTIR
ncbi:MAG: dethiobiotin synthase [Cytophagales bacterium]